MEPQLELNVYEDNVKKTISTLKITKEKRKEQNAMLKSLLHGDADFHDLMKEKEAIDNRVKARKLELLKTDSAKDILNTLEFLGGEVKEQQLTLSGYLLAYVEKGGADTIEIDSKVRKIVKVAKLKSE